MISNQILCHVSLGQMELDLKTSYQIRFQRSDPCNINSHALTTRTGLEVIQSDKVPRSDPYNKDSHALTTRDRDGFEHAPQMHPGKREGHALTKMLVQTGQEVANRKASREQSKKCWKKCVEPETPEFKFEMLRSTHGSGAMQGWFHVHHFD